MKKLTILFAVLVLTACEPATTQTPAVQIAAEKIGLQEYRDRVELREYTGVDPVRTEWCAAFVNAVLNESGIEGSESVRGGWPYQRHTPV